MDVLSRLFPSTLRRLLKFGGTRSAKWGSKPPRDPVISAWMGMNGETASGVYVDSSTAESIAAVYACVRYIGTTLAMLPLVVYRRLGDDDRERDPTHSLYDVLHSRPNAYQTSLDFRRMLQRDALLRGDGFARIVAGAGQAVREMHRLHPDLVTPFWRDAAETQIAYQVRKRNGVSEVLLQGEVFHLRGMGDDPLRGMNPIELHRETLGEHLGAQLYNARAQANDARPGGLLETSGRFKDDAERVAYLKSFENANSGENRGRVALLEGGVTFKELAISARDMEFLQQRKYSRREIAAIYGVPPHKIGDLENATFSNIEQQAQEAVTDCILPWAVAWEQAISRDLFTESSRRTHFASHVMEGLLRADSAARGAFYKELLMSASITPNQIASRENLPRYDGGDRYYIPANMVPVDKLDEFMARNSKSRAEGLPA